MAASAKANLPTKSPHVRRVVDAVCLQSGQASKSYVAETFEMEIISGRSRNLRSGILEEGLIQVCFGGCLPFAALWALIAPSEASTNLALVVPPGLPQRNCSRNVALWPPATPYQNLGYVCAA
jgi:hypothetical protein